MSQSRPERRKADLPRQIAEKPFGAGASGIGSGLNGGVPSGLSGGGGGKGAEMSGLGAVDAGESRTSRGSGLTGVGENYEGGERNLEGSEDERRNDGGGVFTKEEMKMFPGCNAEMYGVYRKKKNGEWYCLFHPTKRSHDRRKCRKVFASFEDLIYHVKHQHFASITHQPSLNIPAVQRVADHLEALQEEANIQDAIFASFLKDGGQVQGTIIVVGEPGVGKTCFLRCITTETTPESEDETTKDGSGICCFDSEQTSLRVEVREAAGGDENLEQRKEMYNTAIGVVLMYDVTKRETFENIERWRKEVKEHTDINIVTMLVGNKLNLLGPKVIRGAIAGKGVEDEDGEIDFGGEGKKFLEREVPVEVAKDYAHKHNMLFCEMSGRLGSKLEELKVVLGRIQSRVTEERRRSEQPVLEARQAVEKTTLEAAGGGKAEKTRANAAKMKLNKAEAAWVKAEKVLLGEVRFAMERLATGRKVDEGMVYLMEEIKSNAGTISHTLREKIHQVLTEIEKPTEAIDDGISPTAHIDIAHQTEVLLNSENEDPSKPQSPKDAENAAAPSNVGNPGKQVIVASTDPALRTALAKGADRTVHDEVKDGAKMQILGPDRAVHVKNKDGEEAQDMELAEEGEDEEGFLTMEEKCLLERAISLFGEAGRSQFFAALDEIRSVSEGWSYEEAHLFCKALADERAEDMKADKEAYAAERLKANKKANQWAAWTCERLDDVDGNYISHAQKRFFSHRKRTDLTAYYYASVGAERERRMAEIRMRVFRTTVDSGTAGQAHGVVRKVEGNITPDKNETKKKSKGPDGEGNGDGDEMEIDSGGEGV
ncbi:hypothetical protein HK097_000290 [Rhizophlyctis rosea]|uniref:Uncharacterized protein n=1 Tax=Rhizophlyctis rosea TaxID=64517 RepID=A0AAD5SJS1_9FUNG|nr:hypothetical protein HK097_000290 [Rhizophlyctis rosea]